jgi:hypothetical protein
MTTRSWNWRLWIGFALSLVAAAVCIKFFLVIRAVFWLSLGLFLVAAALLSSGLKLAFKQPQSYRGKVAGPILTALSVGILALFGLGTYLVSKSFPNALNAPKVGEQAPAFKLVDANNHEVSLAQLVSTPIADASSGSRPTKGVLLVFYRGYW